MAPDDLGSTGLTSAGLTFGLGISPTNVVGSVFSLNVGVPSATGAANSGLSNGNVLGTRASGFLFTSEYSPMVGVRYNF